MPNPDDVDLVRRAILSHTTGDCEWDERAARRIRGDRYLQGLTPEGIRELLQEHVAQHPDSVKPMGTEFHYKVIIPDVEDFKHGLFVEIILVDEDPEAPAVQIVNAHEQTK